MGSFVAHVVVQDKDSGRNGQVNCSLVTNNVKNDTPFKLEQLGLYASEYKLVTSLALDRESRDQYMIVITCRDNGVKSLVTHKRLSINISDTNDCSPVFLPTSYYVTLLEGNQLGLIVVQVGVNEIRLQL